jgi:inner membrane protein
MDNVTHTLAGALLAECGLKKRAALAYPALLIGANLADIDVLSYLFGGGLTALGFRRGWTHGILAVAIFPFVLAFFLVWWESLRRRRADIHSLADRRRSGFGALVGVSAVAIVSHPLLDLLNNYGVRLLMPFSSRMFYGDSAFIIDPWMLILMIGGIWLARRERGVRRREYPIYARVALVLLFAYIGTMVYITKSSERALADAAGVRGSIGARTLMVAPEPIRVATRNGLVDTGAAYESWRIDWSPTGSSAERTGESVPKGTSDPRAAAALATPKGERFLRWSRFPYAVTGVNGDSGLVHLGDARYGNGPAPTWASVRVRVAPVGSMTTSR